MILKLAFLLIFDLQKSEKNIIEYDCFLLKLFQIIADYPQILQDLTVCPMGGRQGVIRPTVIPASVKPACTKMSEQRTAYTCHWLYLGLALVLALLWPWL